MGNRKAREWQHEQDRRASWERLRGGPWSPDDDLRAFGSGKVRAQVIHLPSFDPPSFWEVCALDGGWVLYTAAVVADWYPGPLRLQGYDLVPFPPEKLRGFVGRLMSVSVPVAPHLNDMGCVDGTVTRLTLFGDLFSCVRFQWWSDYPPGWAPLVRMADEMIAAFGGRPVDE
jgi:hypothetical protein